MTKKESKEISKKEITLSELVSNKLKLFQKQREQAQTSLNELVGIVLAEKGIDLKPGTKVSISDDFKKILY